MLRPRIFTQSDVPRASIHANSTANRAVSFLFSMRVIDMSHSMFILSVEKPCEILA